MKSLILILALLLSTNSFTQGTWIYSVQDGAWEDSATWNIRIPTERDFVHIYHDVTKNGDLNINGSGASLITQPGSSARILGNLSSTGNNTSIQIYGGSSVDVQGDLDCYNCRTDNGGDLYVDGNITMHGGYITNNCYIVARDIEYKSGTSTHFGEKSIVRAIGHIITNAAINMEGGVFRSGGTFKIDTSGTVRPSWFGTSLHVKIVAFDSIINNGSITGDPTNLYYLEDDDCVITGTGTMTNVNVCVNEPYVETCGWVGSTPMPVELSSVKAIPQSNGSVLLHWTARIEENFSHYEIQKLHDNNWTTVGSVASLYNNSIRGGKYDYTDYPEVFSDIVYYRLKMIDTDGSFEYSDIVSAQIEIPKGSVYIYPNPVTGDYLNLVMESGRFSSIRIVSLSGKIVKRLTLADNGENEVSIGINDLPTAIYLLEIKGVNETIFRKFVKH